MSKFNYFYRNEADQFRFFKIPKMLFLDEGFKYMSVSSKMLYGLMLDRMSLSRENEWFDKEGRVYIYYTLASIQEELNCGHSKAVAILKELDKEFGLIERKKQGLGLPDRIYVLNFAFPDRSKGGQE